MESDYSRWAWCIRRHREREEEEEEFCNQAGFGSTTSFVGTTDNGQSYVANLTNPFPSGFTLPLDRRRCDHIPGPNPSASTRKALKNPYMQRWQFAVQHQLPFTSLSRYPTLEIAAPGC